jgi:ankyrin repeat protein
MRTKQPFSGVGDNKHVAMVELLLQHRAGFNNKTNSGGTLLHRAVEHSSRDIVSLLLTHEGDTNAKDKQGSAAIHLAAYYEHTNVLQQLLDHNEVEINRKDGSGATVLHWAVLGRKKIVSLLLGMRQATLLKNARDDNQETALDWAMMTENNVLIRFLRQG